jgi:histone H3/H4
MKTNSIQGIRAPSISRMIERSALTDSGNIHHFFLKKGYNDEKEDNDEKDDKKRQKENVRISSLMFEEVRILIKEDLDILLKNVMNYLELKKEKVVKETHVYPFLISIPATIPDLKLCDSKVINKQNCFYFPEASFRKLIKEVGEDYRIGVKFSKEALQLIQYEIEKIVYEQLKYAVLQAINAKRHTVFPKDLQLSRRVFEDYHTKQFDYSYNNIDEIFSFEDFYEEILKLLCTDEKNELKITEKYSEQLDFFINVMLHKLLKISSKVLKNNKLTTRDIKYALLDLFPRRISETRYF